MPNNIVTKGKQMNNKPRIVFFSIQTPTTNNSDYIGYVESIISKYGFKEVLGSYKGVLEKSYMVIAKEDKALEQVMGLAEQFNQESVLIVDENRKATLKFVDGGELDKTELGNFVSISALEAQNLENWTLAGTNYYSVI